jgi:hypothetical protein
MQVAKGLARDRSAAKMDENPEFDPEEDDILEPAEEDDLLEPAETEENPALEGAPAVATATVEEEAVEPSPLLQRMIDDDTILFLEYGCEEDFIAVLEGEGSREPPEEPKKRGGFPFLLVFVILLLLGGGGFALWWFALR